MEDYRDGISGRAAGNGGTNPDAQEAKRLRNQLVEYDGYLQEMRKTNMKNVETLDVIQRYTDKSAAGIQALTEEGASGMQKLAEEGLQGIQKLAQECSSGLKRYSASGEQGLNRMSTEGAAQVARLADEGAKRLEELAAKILEISNTAV